MAEPRRSDTPFRDEAAQQALGAVLGANPFVRLDPTELLATAGRVGLAAARPGLLARHARHLGRELAAIAAQLVAAGATAAEAEAYARESSTASG